MTSPFQRVAIIGAGTMGHGIAQVTAAAGVPVALYDIKQEAVDRGLAHIAKNLAKGVARGKVTEAAQAATLANLRGSTDLEDATRGCDLVVEAIPEKLELKQDLFRRLAAFTAPTTVLGTNTSSISIARIAQAAQDPARVIGLHFFNPVHIMKLLEVIQHPGTAPEVIEQVRAYGSAIRKTCVFVNDMPGFATSRLGLTLGMEAIRMMHEGVASAEDIDSAMTLGYGHPVGPLKLTDIVGLDVRLHIGEYLARELGNAAFEPPQLMRDMVAAGTLGKKSQQGFYSWQDMARGGPSPDSAADVIEQVRAYGAAISKSGAVDTTMPAFATARLGAALAMEAIRMVQDGVASAEGIDTAMNLGYRHPIGPLKLADTVGLDVLMGIGETLSGGLGNAAFAPPQLMRDMVAAGKLGKSSGQGFYSW
jgi:3-hydroxybutyryl-CoA dehydrogenase